MRTARTTTLVLALVGTAIAAAPATAAKRCGEIGASYTSITGTTTGDVTCKEAGQVARRWLNSNDGQRPNETVFVTTPRSRWYCVANYSRAGRPVVKCRIPKNAPKYRNARVTFRLSAE